MLAGVETGLARGSCASPVTTYEKLSRPGRRAAVSEFAHGLLRERSLAAAGSGAAVTRTASGGQNEEERRAK